MPRCFDAHCHFLDIQYVVREGLALALAHMAIEGGGTGAAGGDPVRTLLDVLGTGLFHSPSDMMEDLEAAVLSMQSTSASAGASPSFAAIPMMMDLFYMLDDGSRLLDPGTRSSGGQTASSADAGGRFAERIAAMVGLAGTSLAARIRTIRAGAAPGPRRLIDAAALEGAMGSIARDVRSKTPPLGRAPGETELSWGFAAHMAELEALKKSKPRSVYPFLAVDPRRPGILRLVQEKVGPEKPFAGIKLYPSLGYLPTHPALFPIYEYCANNDAPVTFHCARGMIQTMCKTITIPGPEGPPVTVKFTPESTPFDFFAAPDKWEPVLKKYGRRLRVNFAHFGGTEEILRHERPDSWTRRIIALMKTYRKSVYTDMSCTTDPRALDILRGILQSSPLVRSRMMFGTDYDVELMFKPIDEYCRDAAAALRPHLRRLMRQNPEKFLGRAARVRTGLLERLFPRETSHPPVQA